MWHKKMRPFPMRVHTNIDLPIDNHLHSTFWWAHDKCTCYNLTPFRIWETVLERANIIHFQCISFCSMTFIPFWSHWAALCKFPNSCCKKIRSRLAVPRSRPSTEGRSLLPSPLENCSNPSNFQTQHSINKVARGRGSALVYPTFAIKGTIIQSNGIWLTCSTYLTWTLLTPTYLTK